MSPTGSGVRLSDLLGATSTSCSTTTPARRPPWPRTFGCHIGDETSWDTVRSLCPRPDRELDDGALDDALGVLADFADLKSPYTLGHSRAVADLAEAAAVDLGMDGARRRDCSPRGPGA
jgi:HD-GYP domain-containing protein (c-di-GMP phosphodiesterase class II)